MHLYITIITNKHFGKIEKNTSDQRGGYIIITLLQIVCRVCQFNNFNKEFELMLMRRAKAYSSSGSVY